MANIMFFNIPAHGHTNPTIEVVRELVKRGHRVRYYSFPEFKEKLESAGAEYISCEKAMPPAPENLEKRVGKDFALLIEMVIDVTENLHEQIEGEIARFQPDCIVSDSVCIWGKLFARRFEIPLICSTTTLAFNRYTVKLMKQSFVDMLRLLIGMPSVIKKLGRLEALGYEAKSVIALLQNDNETDTIVYTSKLFQPMAETFSDRYAFVGPSVAPVECTYIEKKRPLVYVSLGTVLHKNLRFYRMCIDALAGLECDVIMSVGSDVSIESLGHLHEGFEVHPRVDQMDVLTRADVFITHCGMNSAMESLYSGVPMVLCPQHAEERAVANRVCELGAGIRLRKENCAEIRHAVSALLRKTEYRETAARIGVDMKRCGGARAAAEWIEKTICDR